MGEIGEYRPRILSASIEGIAASATGRIGPRASGATIGVEDTDANLRRPSTDNVLETDRPSYWLHVVGEAIGGFELRDYESDDLGSSPELTTIGDIKIGHSNSGGEKRGRTAQLVKSSNPDDLFALGGHTLNFERCPGRGGMVLIDVPRPYPGYHADELDVIEVFIPRPVMERAIGPARQAGRLSIDASQPSFPVIMAFLRSLCHYGASLDSASAARLSAIAVDLIASGFAEKMGQAPSCHASGVILCRAQAYIAENLGVSGLGMLEVAAKLNISVRRLHQIAAAAGISLVDWMWERRLQQARTMLVEAARQSQSVGAIAYQCGFVDPAHFSRRFKLRFGQAPSEARASPQRGGA